MASLVFRWVRHIVAGSKGLWLFMRKGYGYDFVILLGLALVLSWWFGASRLGIVVVGLMGVLTLAAEMFNGAVERVCDLVQPDIDPRVKVIKDLSCGGVLAVGFVFVIVTVCVCCLRL